MPGLVRLAEGVYARVVSPDSNAVANSGFVVLDHSVIVFDTHFTPEAGAELLDAVRAVTDLPVRYVVNSHGHTDHTHGNQVFAAAHIVGSDRARRDVVEIDLPAWERSVAAAKAEVRALRADGASKEAAASLEAGGERLRQRERYLDTISRLRILAPQVTFERTLSIREGGREVRLLHLGNAHTEGDIVLYLPGEKIAFVGDLFFNRAIPNTDDGRVLEWGTTVDAVLALDAETFIPGHGDVGSREDVRAFARYLRDLQSLVRPAVERGDSLQQAIATIPVPAAYASWGFQNFFPANVQKMYIELKELQAPTPEENPSGKR
ncbi:MAG: MBL fold metallo-hydrolase [Acidobacteria bacterium]|nr:MBL fold metallo-hydrolase [Acidobacteriota bacterium]